MKSTIKTIAALSVAALLATACAQSKPKKDEPVKAAQTTTEAKSSYVVKKGDSLWKISGKSKVLGDSFRWPLLFKANRDQIEDPDLIDVKLDLSYKVSYSKEEISDAVQKAKDTPAFVPHDSPRKSLPVKY